MGYELPAAEVEPFLDCGGGRTSTGYKYWSQSGKGEKKLPYEPKKALLRAAEHAQDYLDKRVSQMTAARDIVDGQCISLCACNAGLFGHLWHEGIFFLETLFREGAKRKELQFMNPVEYLYKQDTAGYQTMMPEFSSWGTNGYAETWLDAPNDWIYRHIFRSLERMTELAERFPDDTGLKERALNQAAREILLVQESDWPRLMHHDENAKYARSQVESSLRNFTTIYEALGSSYISTEWLTTLERRNNIFPAINYRVFRRKK
ncbi:1,4-alpha-glucan branching protein domain-containing protein [Breznakiella homolactica]|uniref:1,4-alpha-glucan branching protein domain-containing protein n=1 Tax=Breznakiella homolactica TaxID=2798577 RepID=UPI001CBA65A7|nr:1,4-alpha-glucan branching protein domain-containing protein [Breznakiella homolactica]